jgi:uncharacterized membrane protein
MRKGIAVSLAMVAAMFVLSIWLYPDLPEQVATHWNAAGVADGFSDRLWAVALLPIVSLGILALFALLPRIDPLRSNILKFMPYYDGMVIIFSSFMLYIHVITLALNLGWSFSILAAMSPAFAALFYYIGIMLGKTKRNWFVGIRTPWTLSSDRVWDKTHRLGGRLFRAAGVIALFGVLFTDYAILLMIGPVMLAAAYSVIYSYLEYQKEGSKKAARK